MCVHSPSPLTGSLLTSLTPHPSQRIDRLMFVTKSLVGEAYLVYGIAEPRHRREEAEEEEERRWLVGQESRRDSLESMV